MTLKCDSCGDDTCGAKRVIINIKDSLGDLEYGQSFFLHYKCLLKLWKKFEEFIPRKQSIGGYKILCSKCKGDTYRKERVEITITDPSGQFVDSHIYFCLSCIPRDSWDIKNWATLRIWIG